MTLSDIYNFFLNYQIPSAFAAMLRIAWPGYAMFAFTVILKDVIRFTHPSRGVYNGSCYNEVRKWRYPQYSLFNWFPESTVGYWLVIVLFYVSGIMSCIGFLTNASLLVFFIVAISLLTRIMPLVSCGADAVHRMLYFSLIFIDCGSQYSVDNILGIATNQPYINGWTIRILQIFLCGAYMCSSFSKLGDKYWITGQVLRNSIYHAAWGKRAPLFLKIFKPKWVYKPLAHSVAIFEWLAFPLYFIQEIRPFAVFFGVSFHIGILILLRIGIFGPIMILLNLVFLDFLFY